MHSTTGSGRRLKTSDFVVGKASVPPLCCEVRRSIFPPLRGQRPLRAFASFIVRKISPAERRAPGPAPICGGGGGGGGGGGKRGGGGPVLAPGKEKSGGGGGARPGAREIPQDPP